MRVVFYTCLIFLVSLKATSQDWTWMKGPKTNLTNGVYGALGVPSSTVFPGSRHGGANWVDASGALWLFGGEGHGAIGPIGWVNDLWKYNPTTNQWTWVKGPNTTNGSGIYGTKGVSAPSNIPGAREFAASWIDAAGKFWLCGGDGWDAIGNFGHLSDLWKYDPFTNEWTWIHGSSLADQNGIYGIQGTPTPVNFPGGRISAQAVIDASGNVWLFGGFGFPEIGNVDGCLNDLWKYNPATNEWCWMKGSNAINSNGTYGTILTPNPINTPGARQFLAMWVDGSGNLFLFGGNGYGATGGLGYLNDTWKYLSASNRWVWIHGSNATNANGTYGSIGVQAPGNVPGARNSSASWIDSNGKLWLFGGMGFPATGGVGRLNDLFRFDPVALEWTWMKGQSAFNNYGVYGTISTTTPTNNPGSRYYTSWWKDLADNLWLFGGNGWPETGAIGNLCDLWKFTMNCSPENSSLSSNMNICTNNSSTLNAVSSNTGIINWYNSPTSTVSIGTGSVFITPVLIASSSPLVINYYASNSNCAGAYLTPISVTVNPTPTISVISSQSLVCSGQTATLSASGAVSYSWSTGSTNSTTIVSPVTSTNYTVTGYDSLGCKGNASYFQLADPCLSVSAINHISETITIGPIPNQGNFSVYSPEENLLLKLYDANGKIVCQFPLKSGNNEIKLLVSSGIYYYQISQHNSLPVSHGKMIVLSN